MRKPKINAFTKTRLYDDGQFIRTALVVGDGDTGSVDLVDTRGVRLAQVNISFIPKRDGEEVLIVDVIDVDKRYTERRALVFSPTSRQAVDVPEGGNLVSTDFRVKR